jgi:hypothetical protein
MARLTLFSLFSTLAHFGWNGAVDPEGHAASVVVHGVVVRVVCVILG